MSEGRTHFFGDDCPGGHLTDPPVPTTAAHVLRVARGLLGRGWTQGFDARNAKGQPCDLMSPNAVAWSIPAAIDRVMEQLDDPPGLFPNPLSFVNEVVADRFEGDSFASSATEANEDEHTTQEMVLGWMDEAIRLAEGRGQ